jgi:hypothetical protein
LSTDNLLKSNGYLSLRHEMRVRDILTRLGWRATHGGYYTDPREKKERELDVSAVRSWRDRKGHIVHLTLLIECKAAQHAMLADLPRKVSIDGLYYQWLGEDDDWMRAAIAKAVQDTGFDVRRVMERFESKVYPGGLAAVKRLLIDAPKSPCRASSTRDAKDDDDVWDAAQQVFSAMFGTIETESAALIQQLRDDLRFRDSPEDDTTDYAVSAALAAASSVILFHPIVSIAAPLKLVDASGEITDVPWCRIERARVFGWERQWLDLVNLERFEKYAQQLTSWYDRVLGRICEPIERK